MSTETFHRADENVDQRRAGRTPDARRRPRIRAAVVAGALLFGAVGTVVVGQALSSGSPPEGAPVGPADGLPAAADLDVPPAPDAVSAPPGVRPVAVYRVDIGNQIYVCRDGAFTLKAPEERLVDDNGRSLQHLGGPSWRSNTDRSALTAAKLTESPVPGAIPELLLEVKEHSGPNGELTPVTHIQRLRTTGGVAPAGACTDGGERSVPYGADYVFLAPN